MNGLRVVKAGPQSLLQDDGRRGWQHLGVSPGGPLDRQAAAWANRLLGNPWGTPLLEIAFGGLVLECRVEATWLALTGARLALTVDGRECLPWSRFRVRRGQRIELGFAEVEVATQAEAIAQVRSLSRNLGLVFWIVAALAIGGAFAAIAASSLAAVERKRRALAVLRLLGFPTAALVGFVMLLALFSAVFGLFLAGLLYAATAGALNHLFDNQSGEFVCRLLPSHYLTALLATLLCSVLAAASGGWRAARIEAAEGLRDV